MATRGFFSKRDSEGFPYYLNFSNNIGVPHIVQSIVVSAVDHLGNPAPEVLGSVTILPPYRVSVEVTGGVDETVYTITGTATDDEGHPFTVIADMLIDNEGSYDDQLGDIEAKIDAIKAKTDNLTADPADQSEVEAAIASSESAVVEGTEFIRKILSNRLEINEAASKLIVYADDGTTPLLEWPLTDSKGRSIVMNSGPPVNRGARTL